MLFASAAFARPKDVCCRICAVHAIEAGRQLESRIPYVKRETIFDEANAVEKIRRENKERKWLLHCQISNVVAADVTIPTNVPKHCSKKRNNLERNKKVHFAVEKC